MIAPTGVSTARSARRFHSTVFIPKTLLEIFDRMATTRQEQARRLGGLGGPWPPWATFSYGGKGVPLRNGVILGNFGGLPPMEICQRRAWKQHSLTATAIAVAAMVSRSFIFGSERW